MFASSRIKPLVQCALIFLLTGGLSAVAAPNIHKVESHFIPTAETAPSRNFSRIGLSKFDGLGQPGGKQVFFVHWDPGAASVPKGSQLIFEYYQSRFPRPQGLRISYPFEITNPRKATYTIADKAFREGGPVKRWRVRLLNGNKILAEKVSPSWKK